MIIVRKVGSIRNSTGWYEGTCLKEQSMQLSVSPVSTSPYPKMPWSCVFLTSHEDGSLPLAERTMVASAIPDTPFSQGPDSHRERPEAGQELEARVSREWTISQDRSFTSTVPDPWF